VNPFLPLWIMLLTCVVIVSGFSCLPGNDATAVGAASVTVYALFLLIAAFDPELDCAPQIEPLA
jgi:hypothetical protein